MPHSTQLHRHDPVQIPPSLSEIRRSCKKIRIRHWQWQIPGYERPAIHESFQLKDLQARANLPHPSGHQVPGNCLTIFGTKRPLISGSATPLHHDGDGDHPERKDCPYIKMDPENCQERSAVSELSTGVRKANLREFLDRCRFLRRNWSPSQHKTSESEKPTRVGEAKMVTLTPKEGCEEEGNDFSQLQLLAPSTPGRARKGTVARNLRRPPCAKFQRV